MSSPTSPWPIRVKRKLNATDVLEAVADVMIPRGSPAYALRRWPGDHRREWTAAVSAQTGYIAPGSPWKNGYCESFNNELLKGEVCAS